MSPRYNAEGKPYGPWRYNEIIKECYFISKQIHTSYNELLDITPTERRALLSNIEEDLARQKEHYDEMVRKKKSK